MDTLFYDPQKSAAVIIWEQDFWVEKSDPPLVDIWAVLKWTIERKITGGPPYR